MKKICKRLLATVLTVIIVLGVIPFAGIDWFSNPITSFAANDETFKIVLTWGSSPSDLDSHVTGKLSNGGDFHVYYGNKSVSDNGKTIASLDTDDTSSYGPETIIINPNVPGVTYTYYIYNFSGGGTITGSNATVKLYKGNNLIGTYNPPTDNSGARYWTLFRIKDGKVFIVNQIGDSVLSDIEVTDGYKKVHVIDNFKSENADYISEYLSGDGIPLDGSNGNPDLCIPGQSENMIPQGLAYYPEKNWILISAYDENDERASVIFALDKDTNDFVAQFNLRYSVKTPCKQHVGGIGVSDNNLYITKDSGIAYIPLSDLNVSPGTVKDLYIKGEGIIPELGEANASYLDISNNRLWVGNFYWYTIGVTQLGELTTILPDSYDVPASANFDSIIAGYNITGRNSEEEWENLHDIIDSSVKQIRPCDYYIGIPGSVEAIQGMTTEHISGNEYRLWLSRTIDASFSASLSYITIHLDNSNNIYPSADSFKSFENLPGAQNIIFINDDIYTVYESAALSQLNSAKGLFWRTHDRTDVLWKVNVYKLLNIPNPHTPYRVEHYVMNENGQYPSYPTKIESKVNTPIAVISLPELKDSSLEINNGIAYSSGTIDGVSIPAGLISADGTTVIKLYYSRNKYELTLSKGTGISSVSGGGTYYYGQTVNIDAALSDGYTWSKWSDGNTTKSRQYTMPASSTILTASASPVKYTISYNLNGGSVSTANPASYYITTADFTLNNPTIEYHSFAGWTGTGLSKPTKNVTISKGSTGNRSYTATWNHTADDEWTVVDEATCMKDGLEVLLCREGGEVLESRTLPKTDHIPEDEWVVIKEPSCMSEGWYGLLCRVCGMVLDESIIEATGHIPENEWITFEPTCLNEGAKVLRCRNCHEILDELRIAPLGHMYEWVVLEEPTSTTDGVRALMCRRCGNISETEVIPACAFDYYISNGNAIITRYNGSDTEVVIPAQLGECPVTRIEDWAFSDNISITSVTIPDSVTSIGDYAFRGCSGLTSVTIPDSVTSIGDYAFRGCSGLTGITIPDSVTSIGDYAFCNCSGLTSVTIPDSVTSIGDYAFLDCRGLTNITIPDSVTSIGDYAFWGCACLTSITIPDSIANIGVGSFAECTGLTSITIPDSVTAIGNYAFCNCSGLTSVTIPDSVTSIGFAAFENCTGLTSVTIPDSVTSIGDYAFRGCSGLTSVTIPDSVTSIGDYAFYDCRGLTNITIPDSVTSIGLSAFENCSGLTSVTIPDSVTSIGDYAFYNCGGLTSITIPDSVTSIGDNAFSNCWRLTSLVIPDSVTSISETAFRYCYDISEIFYEGTPDEWNELNVVLDSSEVYIHYGVSAEEVSDHLIVELIEEPGCEYSGVEQVSCSCGYSHTRYVPAKGHILGEALENHEPTCTTDGYTVHYCSRCEQYVKQYYTGPLGHNFENDVCTRCGLEIQTIALNELKNIQLSDDVQSRILKFVPEESGVYYFFSDTVYDTYSILYDSEMNWIGSDNNSGGNGNFLVSHELEKGKTYYLEARVLYSDWNGSFLVSVTDNFTSCHDGTVIDIIPPSCEGRGCTVYNCRRCGMTYTDNYTEPLGHEAEWVSTHTASCGEECTEYLMCTRCNRIVANRTVVGEHNFTHVSIPASCTANGMEFDCCLICGMQENVEIIPASHNFGEWSITEYPSESSDGTAERVCSKCGKTERHAIPFALKNCSARNRYIFGIKSGTSEGTFFKDYLSDEPVWSEAIFTAPGSENGMVGTGSTMSICDNGYYSIGYIFVIFGDVNCDGWYDSMDSIIVNCLANGLLSRDQVGEAAYMAADCNHDGVIDEADVALLEQAGIILASVDQTKTEAELMTDSAYVEYLNLIDQNPAEKTPAEEAPTDIAPTDEPVDEGFNKSFVERLIDFIIYIVDLMKSFIAKY